MRLIDADALMDDINELKKSPWYNSDINGSRVVRSEALDIVQRLCIEDAPTIDAVEVVRCKDCKHYNTTNCCDGCGWCERSGMDRGTWDNWFCADGVRKDEPQTETPYACGKCPYHEQCNAEDWRSCRYDYVSGRYIDSQEREGE